MTIRIENVMLVDDEKYDQLIYKRVLDRSGLVGTVHSFTYAEEALVFLKQKNRPKIDVIFLDINMPRMNGFEFLQTASAELQDSFTDAVIIMLTTSLDPKDQDRANEFEIVRDFINKPLTIEHVQKIADMLKAQS
jgi:CheY-like chemotaxis protein